MLVENCYPDDLRVKNEAALLTSAGYQVAVIALGSFSEPKTELIEGVRVYRVPRLELFKKTPAAHCGWAGRVLLKLKSLLGYMVEYGYFTSACLLISLYHGLRHGIDVIHAHNPPDTLFLVALPFKLIGKKFIFDHHDLSPELYQSRYGAKQGLFSRALMFFEWCSLKLADLTIATNESYKEVQIRRGGRVPESIFVVRNGPNKQRMSTASPSARLRSLQKCILCYVGRLNPQDGVDYLLRSLHHLLYVLKRDDFYCVIIGSGDSLEDLRALARELRLEAHVEFPGFVSDAELEATLAAADVCVDPDPSSPLNDVSTWIKIMEYMAKAKPVVAFDLKETRVSAQEAALYVPPNDEAKFAEAVRKLIDDPKLRKRMGDFGRERVERELQWSIVSRNLLSAYKRLSA